MRRAASASAAILLSIMATPSSATPVPLSARWTIDTSKVPSHLDLRKGEVLLSATLLPSKLVEIASPAVTAATGDVRAEAGGQFMLYTDTTGEDVYCSTKIIDLMKKTGLIVFRPGDVFLCLLDRDHDGKFDQSYQVRSGLQTEIPIVALGKTDGWVPITPVSYDAIAPARFNVPLALVLRWEYGSGVTDRVGFSVEIRDLSSNSKENRLRLSTWFGLKAGQMPGAFDFANIRLHVASTAQKAIAVEVERVSEHATMQMTGARVAFARN